ncbi:MAG TPA: MFS transporter [Actinocrinis sp.]|jgi:MFS family permease
MEAGSARPDAALRRARGALYAAFGAQGFSLIALTSEIPTLETRLHIGDTGISLIMAGALIVAAVGSVLAGVLTGRFGSRIVLRVSQLVVLGALIGIGAMHAVGPALPFAMLIGGAIGAVDATTNMQAVALQKRYGRSIIQSCYGVWAAGAALGSACATIAIDVHLSLVVFYVAATVVIAPGLIAVGPRLLAGVMDETVARDPVTGRPPAIAWRPMIAICVALALAYFADSTVSSAGGLYIKQDLHGHSWEYTIVYFAYAVPFMAVRFVGDRLTERFGGVPVGRAGAVVAALGFAIAIAAPDPILALAGFGVVGLGVAVMAPLSFAAAGRLDPAESGVAVARLNIFNYVGFLFGSSLVTGLFGAGVPERAAIAVPLVSVAAIAALAFGFGEYRTAEHFAAAAPAPTPVSTSAASAPADGAVSPDAAATTPTAP